MENGYNIEKRRKIFIKGFIGIWLVIVMISVIYFVTLSILHMGKQNITIKVAPYAATVFVDGKKVNNDSSVYLANGEHQIFAFLDNFEIYEEKITIPLNENFIVKGLIPVNQVGEKIQQDNLDDYFGLESLVEKNIDDDAKKDINNPIQKVLPYTTDAYGIGTADQDGELIVTITIRDGNSLDTAVNKLLEIVESSNISIIDYNFRINGFINQFADLLPNDETDPLNFMSTVCNGLSIECRLYGGGYYENYYYMLTTVLFGNGRYATYRVILQKNGDGNWVFASTPYPILTRSNSPNIPAEVINEVNNLPNIHNANSGE